MRWPIPCRSWLERQLRCIKGIERRHEEKVKVQARKMAQFYNPQWERVQGAPGAKGREQPPGQRLGRNQCAFCKKGRQKWIVKGDLLKYGYRSITNTQLRGTKTL